jgi:hypothetical protein
MEALVDAALAGVEMSERVPLPSLGDEAVFGDLASAGSNALQKAFNTMSCCRFRGHEVKLPALAARSPWG